MKPPCKFGVRDANGKCPTKSGKPRKTRTVTKSKSMSKKTKSVVKKTKSKSVEKKTKMTKIKEMSKKKVKKPIKVEISTNDSKYAMGLVKKTVLNRAKRNIQVTISHPPLNQFYKLSDDEQGEEKVAKNKDWVTSVFTGKFDKKADISMESMPDYFETKYNSEVLFVVVQPDENEKLFKKLVKLCK